MHVCVCEWARAARSKVPGGCADGVGSGIDARAAPAPSHSPVAVRPWKDTLSN